MNIKLPRWSVWVLGVLITILIGLLIFWVLSSPSQPATAPANGTATLNPAISPAPSAVAGTTQAFDKVQLAWFYKPPDASSLSALVQNYDLFILTHKDEGQRDTLKSMGVKSPILAYLLLIEIKDPGSCTKGPQGNQVAYQPGDFCEISDKHPDWFLLDQSGKRVVNGNTYFMDPGNAEYRAFWLERARALQEQDHWDGIFIDNVEVSMNKLKNQGIVLAKYPDDASYQTAIEGFLKYLHDSYFGPSKHPLLANIISVDDWNVWLRYLQYLDGAMIEAFAVDWYDGYRTPSDWKSQLDATEQALSNGKTIIMVSQAEKKNPNPDRQQFALASYLLVANKQAFFRYSDASAYREVLLFDNYSLKLGQPLGPRQKDGSAWRRDFANGYVLVDPQKDSSEIKLNP